MGILELLKKSYVRLTAEGSTTQKAVQSGLWMVGINMSDRLLQMVKLVILASVLSPEAFGLLGIALLSLAALRRILQLGFDQALIQNKRTDIDDYLNTAWILKILRGLVIAFLAYASAPYLAALFNEPKAESLIRIIGLSPVILSIQNPAVVYFQKNLNFEKEFIYQVGGKLVDLVVATVIAFIYQNVWALVYGLIAGNLAKVFLSYAVHQYRPRISFNRAHAREMIGFGKWLMVSGILVFVYGQGDDAFVGWFFGATALGFYQLAYRFSNAPATEVTHVISRVAFPAFSKLQEDVERLREGYFRTVQLSTLIGFPMATGIIIVAPEFVRVFFGVKWLQMVPLMQVLGIWGALRALGANVGAVFKSVGRPDIETKLQVIRVLLSVVLLIPLSNRFGVVGVAYTIIVTTVFIQPLTVRFVLNIIDGSAIRLIRLILFPLSASIVMGGLLVVVKDLANFASDIVLLTLLVGLGAIFYIFIIFVFASITDYDAVSLARNIAGSI
ncbi:lipopolysaccharide biosynthesis protein [Halobium salinum]|uniref:Lipopolysaccharide biosynthesis protein n=1 Tax=Halobium salinum TaxID=1364940 RepID=A0ABD5PB88_9EURY|nr:lipopolysaccharide biosynthesis protein [Halobium salinum]